MKIGIITSDIEALMKFREHLIKMMISRGHQVEVICPENQDYSGLIQLGVAYFPVPFSRTGLNPLKDFKTIFKIAQVLKAQTPELVFSFMIKPVIYGSIASKLSKLDNLYALIPGLGYAFMDESFKGKLLRRFVSSLYRTSLKFNKKVFFQNEDDIDLFVSRGILPREKAVKVNGSGVCLETYKRTEELRLTPSFVFVGRLLKDKGVREFIEAVRILRQKYGDTFEAAIIGKVDENPSGITLEVFNKLNHDGIVSYLGYQSDMTSNLSKFSIFVLPSYREGTPRSALEAMAMKMPIVTTNVPGCREVVIDKENGFLVEPMSAVSLAASMEVFIKSPSLIKKMGEESYQLVRRKFEVSKVSDAYCREMGI